MHKEVDAYIFVDDLVFHTCSFGSYISKNALQVSSSSCYAAVSLIEPERTISAGAAPPTLFHQSRRRRLEATLILFANEMTSISTVASSSRSVCLSAASAKIF